MYLHAYTFDWTTGLFPSRPYVLPIEPGHSSEGRGSPNLGSYIRAGLYLSWPEQVVIIRAPREPFEGDILNASFRGQPHAVQSLLEHINEMMKTVPLLVARVS